MAKAKTYEEALEQITAKKEAVKQQKEDLRTFKTENKIKRGKEVEDPKVAAKLEKLEGAVEKSKEELDALKATAKELRPRKERVSKYEYPADCTTEADKKKYRAKMRREVKAAEKKAAGGDEPAEKKAPKKKPVKKEKED